MLLQWGPSGGPWTDITRTDDVVNIGAAPYSGPDTSSDRLRAVASGGDGGPYTYAWIRRSGSTRITATNPTGSETQFDINAGSIGTPGVEATFDCEVTDGRGASFKASNTPDGHVVFMDDS